ncbi:Uncharacterised protein [Mycobacterium tuberculosis]|nr:Uncharacterised protein [Mycobacterium tuberculosis]
MDAKRATLAGHIVEQLRVFRVIGQHQGELVGDHEQCRDGRQAMPCGDGVFILEHRVERAALDLAAGLTQQHLATSHLAAQRVGEPISQRLLLGHIRDHRNHLREISETVGAGLTLEVGVDDDEPLRGVCGQQRQQNRHQSLRLARTGHADHQPVRAHPALGFVFEVEHQRLAGASDTDRHA